MKALVLLGVLAAGASANAVMYLYDDGSAEANMGVSGGGTLMWLNHFTVVAGGTTIQQIQVTFGDVPNGAAVTVHLWSDPNGDGNPSDAVSLASASSVSANAGTNIFKTFTIPSITRPVGTSIFVGARMSHASNMFPARIDTNSSLGASWFKVGNNPNDLSGAATISGNFMVRASAVPEPATVLALLAGAAGLLRRRR